MPRANRHFVPDLVWHITHRCHERDFLLKFSRDRNSYLRWLYEARKRFGLCVLDYMVTSNQVHLLVKDTTEGVIARSMQLIAGRAAQDYNRRKARLGAFWEDRYHATAIESGAHLHRCVVYIDLNMVRAGVVKHPAQWPHSGYLEIQQPPERYRVVDLLALSRGDRPVAPTAVSMILENFKRPIVNGSKQGRAETQRDEPIAGLSRSRSAARDLLSK